MDIEESISISLSEYMFQQKLLMLKQFSIPYKFTRKFSIPYKFTRITNWYQQEKKEGGMKEGNKPRGRKTKFFYVFNITSTKC